MSSTFSDLPEPLAGPRELPGDPARQAVASIRGIVYQIWWSIDAWLRLSSPDEIIFLEGAEDLDQVASSGAIAGQIKHEADRLSLNNQRSHEALENYWVLSQRESTRRVEFHYITTASAAMERDAQFEGVAGLEAWRIAQTNSEMAARIQAYLLTKLAPNSALRSFLMLATTEQVRERLISRFHWFLAQPGLDQVKQSVDDRLVARLNEEKISLSYVGPVRDRLHSFACDVLVRPESAKRRLGLADLLREIDAATTEHVSVPAHQYQQFQAALQTGAFDPGAALLRVMRLPVPQTPEPLLNRASLVEHVSFEIAQRKAVLLTGTIHKGKTTIAQLVANALCPDAWWFTVASRNVVDIDNLLKAIAACISDESTPSLVVVDNIDLSPNAHAVYGQTLALLVSRARRSGRGLLLTARGESVEAAELSDFDGVQAIDVPEMHVEDVQQHCLSNGCAENLSQIWATFIRGATGGHPKLVQVRISELAMKGWPPPAPAELMSASPAITNAKHIARRMLSGAVAPETAAFVYTAAEATLALTRPMLLSLTRAVGGIINGGDVIDCLHGKWLEQVRGGRLSVTPLLKGAAVDVWSVERRQLAHGHIYDAIAGVGGLDDADAAALLFHAYIAQDARRLAHCARVLESIGEETVSAAVFQHLVWLPYVSLSEGQRFFEPQPFVSAMLRQLQFSVASEIDSEALPAILARWTEEVDQIPEAEPRAALQVMRCSKLLSNRNPRVSLRSKITAIGTLSRLRGEAADAAEELGRQFLEKTIDPLDGIPEGATSTQLYLSLQASFVRDLRGLTEVLDWLELDSDADDREAFEAVLRWPLVNSCGAFVHGAWASQSGSESEWAPTLSLLIRADGLASRFGLAQFGSEVSKALSIVQGEYLHDHAAAMQTLTKAAATFGETSTIREQRVNALFQANDNVGALAEWESLISDPDAAKYIDAFAFRRAGICACRLERWASAEEYFLAGAAVRHEYSLNITRFGLVLDASYVVAMAGAPQRAARMLADMLSDLPVAAQEEGHEDWEALIRLVNGVCNFIDAIARQKDTLALSLPFGKASEPGLSFGSSQPNQAVRTQLAIAKAGLLASQLGSISSEYRAQLGALETSNSVLVRSCVADATLAFEFNAGTGVGFVSALVAYERTFKTFSSASGRPQEGQSEGGDISLTPSKLNVDGLFALFAAAAICCDSPAQAIAAWQGNASQTWGGDSVIVSVLADMTRGLALPNQDALAAVSGRAECSNAEAFGAALVLMQESSLTPEETFGIQRLAASATVCHSEGLLLQSAFGKPVARRFSVAWKRLASSPILFASPDHLPALLETAAAVERGEASIRALLSAAAQSVGTVLGEVENRLE
ncbi:MULTISPECIES: hypothetical protein [Stenotrophomonas]|uniref:ATP-binding protein n=1 Tax=Stenotrophomonas lactitubi TaxID=2045214 RepID=A0AAW4GFE6_9GAMM|nr:MULTISPECIES: hypothetical protein [Stenotrophomonas]MBM9912915.1 hypothetical protein [Stenotrophomonas lactitubi]MBM9922532.1 hypothetical protein [Stenotrophomonas lactitubi]MBM9937557.1 hypothetical protein [Stenotrophomonas lactitubi]